MSYMRKSEWSRCRLNDLSSKCTVHRWKALELSFLLVYGTYALRTIEKLSFQGVLHGTYSTIHNAQWYGKLNR